jgi:heptosyltransferase-2
LQKYLIIQTAFIGDVVLATPLIEKLHAFLPDAQIDFLLRKGNENLLDGHPFLHEVLVWDKKENKQRNLLRLITRIRNNRYDKIINVQRFFATGLLTVFSGARETIGFDKNPMSFFFTRRVKHQVGGKQAVHETVRNQELISIFTDDSLYNRKYITISPASVWFTKQYPADKWVTFIRKIPEGLTIYLLGGPGDAAICQYIIDTSGLHEVKMLAGSLTYLQSAALMSRAVMNYVNDSAPMHFASAMNAPVTAVYCSTVPEFGFGPTSDNSHIVEIGKPLYCRPCGLHGYSSCPKLHFRCAWEIDELQLLKTLPA